MSFVTQRNCFIDPRGTISDAVVLMSSGNPGAINAMMSLITNEPQIGFTDVMRLDAEGIYGENIWIGFKYACGGDVKVFREYIRDGSLKGRIEKDLAFSKWSLPRKIEEQEEKKPEETV